MTINQVAKQAYQPTTLPVPELVDRWTDGPMDRWTDGLILSLLLDLSLLARGFAGDAQAWDSQRVFDTLVSNLLSQDYALASIQPLSARSDQTLSNRAIQRLPLAATVCCNCSHD